ncbi:MAG: DNA polymerase III subunit alpha, partial [Zetaproteobacteria bacterium]
YQLPEVEPPEGLTQEDYLRRLAYEGLDARWPEITARNPKAKRADYEQRLDFELATIARMGYVGYFLIVADFIRWAKAQKIPVGPGRGSGAGSLVAYCLGITNLDPIRYGLLFERFLNPERVSMPDFDIDFCMHRRDEVIDYVTARYGRERVAQIITFGAMKARAVIRDVGRALGVPLTKVDRIARLVPNSLSMTLERALAEEPQLVELMEKDPEVKRLIEIALRLEGHKRNASKHAAGVIIAQKPLMETAPLYRAPGEDEVVVQWDMKHAEKVGLVKFDFLGLKTLTVIDRAERIVREHFDPEFSIERIPLDDPETFKLYREGRTYGVFQVESAGMRNLLMRLAPDCFEDLIAVVALYRPGPLQSGMVDAYIRRKHGEEPVHYPHPKLKPILEETYGVIVYQEQVMQIAQVLAGYTLGQADLLRRAMGKKIPEEMARQRAVFVDGAEKRGLERAKAEEIFDLMEKFAEYGFNKSHSAAYALVSYQTAYLKAHYPLAFMAATMSCEMHSTDKLAQLVRECRAMGIEVRP